LIPASGLGGFPRDHRPEGGESHRLR